MKKTRWRINDDIRAPEVRVIGSDGAMVGVMSSTEALAKAREQELDLVEIAPLAKPPVVKIVDFGKFRYSEEKRERVEKKKAKAAELKEIRFSPFIADGDFNTRVRRIEGFLKDGHKIRIVVVFKGRHLGSKDQGYVLIRKILDNLTHDTSVDMEPKFLGRHLAMVISPIKRKKNEQSKDKKINS
ncbi:translation initiation factor IF-3 [Candidatus Microgenomates bacterium]|nr:MAG: translation initiation factor IF-3 [Candidatus Microgenomates bacterium]